MMTADVVQLAPAGRPRQWPVLIPRTLFTRYQPVLGSQATLMWINLYEMAEGGVTTEFGSVPSALSSRMGMGPEETEKAAGALEKAGLLRRTGSRWMVLWPAEDERDGLEAPVAPVGEVEDTPPMEDGQPTGTEQPEAGETAGWNSDEAAMQAVVQFYHQRIGMLGPSQFEKLRFWVEEQGMSSDVVALAIEETVQSAPTPRLAYVEGVLRNWYNAGVRNLADLQKSKRARSQEVPPTTEGAPNAAAFEAVDREAVRQFREMYADEYDD